MLAVNRFGGLLIRPLIKQCQVGELQSATPHDDYIYNTEWNSSVDPKSS